MKAEYTKLGFKKPEYLENEYGIKIYLGTTDKDNWCVEIPKKFMGKDYEKYCDKDFAIYMISEETALSVARKYTNYARAEETKGYL